jgi:hypothetical protein
VLESIQKIDSHAALSYFGLFVEGMVGMVVIFSFRNICSNQDSVNPVPHIAARELKLE